jgi:hypothetical protein
MNVFGIDFTSRPTLRKPISCLHCILEGNVLCAGDLKEWTDFAAFELVLQRPGPWIAGIDFPFGQARRFIETIGWPCGWPDYVRHVQSLTRSEFREELNPGDGLAILSIQPPPRRRSGFLLYVFPNGARDSKSQGKRSWN